MEIQERKENVDLIWTKEYDQFKLYKNNRNIDTNYISNKVKKSLIEQGWLKSFPMIVDENFNIMDGQHRFLAAKELGIEIPVVIVKNFTDDQMIAINNATKKWSDKDFLLYRAKMGNSVAGKLIRLIDKFNVSVRIAMSAARTGNPKINIREIVLRDFSYDKAETTLEQMIEVLDLIKEKNRRAMAGLIPLIKHDEYNHERMMDKINKQLDRVHHCNSLDGWKEMFENIYNYNSRNKIRVRG